MPGRRRCLLASVVLLISQFLFAANAKKTAFPLADTGADFPIDFSQYGAFSGDGTHEFKYKISDRPGLARAMGEALYPNVTSLAKDPAFIKWKTENPGAHNPWDYAGSGDPQSDFYVWGAARDVGPGVKLLYTGKALAEAGHLRQALKAFHAILANFPKEACWSADHTFVWYVSNEALSQIQAITQLHPELDVMLAGARFKVVNGNDADLANDRFVISPGHWEKRSDRGKPVDLAALKIVGQRGYGRVHAVQYENKQWQLIVDDKPFVVRGMTYNPTPVGQHLSTYGLRWMFDDKDDNGQPDAPYDTWVDANRNNEKDPDEKAVGDFELMKRMGVNAIRIYRSGEGTEYDPGVFNKKVLRDLHGTYGISVIMGDFLGAYTRGSGASWEEGTDYTNPVQLENMRLMVTNYVNDHKAEPYVLMWLLGNENLMPGDYSGVNATRTQAWVQVEAYLKFVNEIAELIHRLDPDHPVAVGNLDLIDLDEHAAYAPAVDIFGTNLYRGAGGFGTMWQTVHEAFDRPVLITEYGCDAWDSRKEQEDQTAQADYEAGNWADIEFHLAGGSEEGNAIGGVLFEFTDEWWKSEQGSWDTHQTDRDGPMAFPDGWASEEWFGVMSLGDGSNSPFMRQPRPTYNAHRDKLWKSR